MKAIFTCWNPDRIVVFIVPKNVNSEEKLRTITRIIAHIEEKNLHDNGGAPPFAIEISVFEVITKHHGCCIPRGIPAGYSKVCTIHSKHTIGHTRSSDILEISGHSERSKRGTYAQSHLNKAAFDQSCHSGIN